MCNSCSHSVPCVHDATAYILTPATCCQPPAPSHAIPPPRSHAVFRTVDDGKTSLLLPKLLYSVLNLAGVCVGLWKMAKMGLLPVTAADWTSYLVPKHAIEYSGVPL